MIYVMGKKSQNFILWIHDQQWPVLVNKMEKKQGGGGDLFMALCSLG